MEKSVNKKRDAKYKKTLILYFNTNSYYFPYVKTENIDCKSVYRNVNKFISILRRIPLMSFIAYGDWKRQLEIYNRVIVFDNAFDKNLGNFLKRNNMNIYVYSWNSALTVDQRECLTKINNLFPVYSFDKNNCLELGLKYASMVYSSDLVSVVSQKNKEIQYDIFFVGWEKGRRSELEKLYKLFKDYSLKVKFVLRSFKTEQIESDFVISERGIEYEEYLELVISSKVLLDFQQEGQEGLTIRMVEALFFQKKIITNKIDIDSYDFYDPSNIFILGKDDISRLKQFVDLPYKKIHEDIVKKYDLKHWVDEYFN